MCRQQFCPAMTLSETRIDSHRWKKHECEREREREREIEFAGRLTVLLGKCKYAKEVRQENLALNAKVRAFFPFKGSGCVSVSVCLQSTRLEIARQRSTQWRGSTQDNLLIVVIPMATENAHQWECRRTNQGSRNCWPSNGQWANEQTDYTTVPFYQHTLQTHARTHLTAAQRRMCSLGIERSNWTFSLFASLYLYLSFGSFSDTDIHLDTGKAFHSQHF